MEVFGNIGTVVEKKTAKSGKEFWVFRLAENSGKEENRSTTWYDVNAFIDELSADLLGKGMFVKVRGRLDVKAYMKKDGTPGASATVLAYSVEPVPKKGDKSDAE